MALLRSETRDFVPPDRCLVGRSRSCDLVLALRDVSGEHAVLQWNGVRWELRDLGSRNGTLVDGQRLAAGARVELAAGVEIRFGHESPPWRLVDAGAPQPMAVALTSGNTLIGEGGYLAVPGPDRPELVVYQDATGQWVVEREHEPRPVEDRALLDAGGLWRIFLPASCGSTWDGTAPLMVASLRLRFTVSRDKEHVELCAWAGERKLDLHARAHHYPLLLLARRRLADRAAGASPADEGWLRNEELRAMLRLSEDHLSISIHRARTQLGKAGVVDAAAVIERRPGMGLLRIGVAALEIVGLP